MSILSLQSRVAYGHVGHSAAVFVLQRLGHQVGALDTVMLSHHPAHGRCRGRVVPATELRDLLSGLADGGFLADCEAVLSGYLGASATGAIVLEAVETVRRANARALYCCDPVMGEVGRGFYVEGGLPAVFRERLVPGADLLTPNPFELEWLTGIAPAARVSALASVEAARRLGPDLVVATGLRLSEDPDAVAVLAMDRSGAWLARAPYRRIPSHGAGDTFTALFLGVYLHHRDVGRAVGHAVAALDQVLAATEQAGSAELLLIAAQDRLADPGIPAPVERLR